MLDLDTEERTEFKKMIPYNTGMKRLILPEYGRLVQTMAEAALQIEDRELRKEYAALVVDVMKAVMQEKSKEPDEKKYWDHLHIMTDFKLDIDGPYPQPQPEAIGKKPEKIPYASGLSERRHYGGVLQKMIQKVAMMENSEEKDLYVDLLSNHIKKMLTINNPENSTDEHVFKDLADMSNGRIQLSPEIFTLLEFKNDKPAKSNSKKKNK